MINLKIKIKSINKIVLLSLVVLSVVGFGRVCAQTMSSPSYKMELDSINFGGNRSTSSSYILEDTVGEIATGQSTSTSFILKAGYQQMQDVYLSIIPADDVVMSPSIGGVTGGTSNGSTSLSVATNNPVGYSITLKASSSPALVSEYDAFDDYVPVGANPDFTFSNLAASSSFAFSPEGVDVDQRFKDDGASCNTGTSETADACWDGLSTSPKTIVSRLTANHPAGTLTTIKFRAESGPSRVQVSGIYVATTTITVLPL